MRKLFALLLCGTMLALLTACGDKDDSYSSGGNSGGLQAMDSPTEDTLDWGDFEIVE